MKRFFLLLCVLSLVLPLAACSSQKEGLQVAEKSSRPNFVEPEVVYLNNCDGKADLTQISERS